MNTSLRLFSKMRLLLPVAILAAIPLRGDNDNGEEHRRRAKDSIFMVLYQGPRVGDPDWTIKSGPVGPDNQKFRDVGGTCSMIPSDVHNVPGSAFERVTFEAKRNHLNVWEMVKTDTITGTASDGNRYTYQNQFTYRGPTTDGKAPKPNRAMPSPGNDGFLQNGTEQCQRSRTGHDRLLHPPDSRGRCGRQFPRALDLAPADPAGGYGPASGLFPISTRWKAISSTFTTN